jgi:hypothetical protein
MTGRLPRLDDGGVLAGVKAKSEWTGLRPGLDPDCGRRPNAVSRSQDQDPQRDKIPNDQSRVSTVSGDCRRCLCFEHED